MAVVKTLACSLVRQKCATVVLKAGKHEASEESILPDRTSIRSLQPEETYKYLGVLEARGMEWKQVFELRSF